jgi:hypothetical protein
MRALSLGSLALFSILELSHLATGGRFLSFGGLLLAALAAFSFLACLLHLGDRYGIDESGIRYANPLMARVGLPLERSVAWSEIRSMRVHHGIRFGVREEHPSALFLEIAGGERFVIDSVEDFDEIHRFIAARLASGEQRRTCAAATPVSTDRLPSSDSRLA